MEVNKLYSSDSAKNERATFVARFFIVMSSMFFLATSVSAATVDQRVERLERMLENQNLMQMIQSLQSLQREVSQLRGDVEVLSFELDKLKKQQKDIYLDLDQRIQRTDQSVLNLQTATPTLGLGAVSPALGEEPVEGEVPVGEVQESLGEQESYQAALTILKSGRYEDAIQAYQVFLISYPESSFAANAQYWMAEAYYVLKDFPSAVSQFKKVISAYPDSRKVSDAYLKVGFAYYELKEWVNAQTALEKVITDYSTSTAARLAQRRIQKMKLEGNL